MAVWQPYKCGANMRLNKIEYSYDFLYEIEKFYFNFIVNGLQKNRY